MPSLKAFPDPAQNSANLNPQGAGRRKFINRLGCAAAASFAVSAAGPTTFKGGDVWFDVRALGAVVLVEQL